MSVVRLVGKEKVSYVSKKTGNQVEGVKLHCSTPLDSKNVEGCVCDSFYVGSGADCYAACLKLPINSDINITYNRYGSIEDVCLIGTNKK